MQKLAAFLALLVALCSHTFSFSQALSVSWPLERSVFQRSGEQGTINVIGQYLGCMSDYSEIQLKVNRLDIDGNFVAVYQNWTTITGPHIYGRFSNSVTLPTGWYQLEIKAVNIYGSYLAGATISRTGVGDVYIIAGQSNAQSINESGAVYTGEGPKDCVVSHNYQQVCDPDIPRFPVLTPLAVNNAIAPSGYINWCYTVLGNQIANSLVNGNPVPVAFFNAANGGSSVLNWQQSAAGGSTAGYAGQYCSDITADAFGQPYKALKNCLQYYAAMFGVRSILWHQGEEDTRQATSQINYQNRLNAVITQSRADMGNNDNLSWAVSRASYDYNNGVVSYNPSVIVAQNQVASAGPNFPGSATDAYDSTYRSFDKLHFSNSGLLTLGNEWKNYLPNGNAIPAETPPDLSLSQNPDGSYSLLAGGTDYRWVDGDGNWSSAFSSSSSITVFNNNTPYRCYVKNDKGQWQLSNKLYTPTCPIGARQGTSTPEVDYGFVLTPFPNPFQRELSVSISLPRASNVRIELINMNGQVVHTVCNNRHTSGDFRYPLNLQQLPNGEYLCRMAADDLFIARKVIKQGQ